MSGQVGIGLSTFEKLAPELGLRVVRETGSKPVGKKWRIP